MTPPAKDVAGYLAVLPEGPRAALEGLRRTIKAAAPQATEGISYQIPTFAYKGPLVAFAAFKDHCGFYVMSPPVMDAHKDELKDYDTAKATIRFRPGEPLPAALVKKLVQARIKENEANAAAAQMPARTAGQTPTTKGGMTMVASDVEATATSDREIVITRVIDAPRKLVFRAWTEPEQVKQWWGPNGFTTTIHEMEVVPGGVWRFIMHGPDGTDYDNKVEYIEVVPPERLVFAHGSGVEDDPGRFQSTVTFAEQDGKTLLTMRALFDSAAARDQAVKEIGAVEGGNQTLARLAEYLAKN